MFPSNSRQGLLVQIDMPYKDERNFGAVQQPPVTELLRNGYLSGARCHVYN